MIFRRSNNTQPNRNTTKNPMNMTTRNNAQENVNKAQNSEMRREPALSTNTANTQMQVTASPTAQNPNVTTSAPPVSPLAMAQARRNPNSPAPAFSRPDQPRKLIVGREISLNGEIATCDHLVVEGIVSATVKDGQILEILEKGSFSGSVEIEQADIAGKFDGDLIVRGKLVIRSTANISGTIRYGSLQVDHGAAIEGQITTLPKQQSTAPTFAAQNETANQNPVQQNTNQQNNTFMTANLQTTAQGQTTMQQNAYLSSVLEQPGFLKASGQ